MAYTASQPVNEVPGFARVGEAVRKGILKVTTPLFGTPENPTTFGKVMNFIDEASAYGTMAGPAAAVGRMRFAAHPVRGPRIVDARFLGSETLPLSNRLAASGTVAAPKSMFSNSPGGIAMVARDGNVILPREADVRLYRSERIRLPNGRSVPLSDIPAIASNIDASSASLAQKQAAVAKLNEAATPYWMYWMYEKDIADANATLARFRSGGRWYDNANVRNYDVLARGDAATVVGNPIGTRYQVGQAVFSPNHVSAMSRDRFIKDPRLFDVYNDGYLPYQSMTFTAAPKLVKGKSVTPVMRVTDHHETVRGPTGSLVYGGSDLKLPHTEYRTYDRTYHVGRDIPYFNFKANEPGGVDLMYMLDNGTPVVRNQGSYSASVAVQQASKGGDSPHRNFRNFLATDKVPDSIFGYPVVQREEDYTPEDLEFFRKNPKAAGFYDMEDGAMGSSTPQQLSDGGVPRPVVPSTVQRQTVAPVSYGAREDGTFKGTGWDRLELPNGAFATEYSVGVNIGGTEMLVPTIIPRMTSADRQMMTKVITNRSEIPREYMERVVAHAKQRLAAGQSPFKDDGLSADDYRQLMGSGFRQFALQTGHETFPGMFWRVGKDGNRELMMGVNKDLDAWGYKRVPDASVPGGWRQHKNTSPIRFSSWVNAADAEDNITTRAVNTTFANMGITKPDLRKALGGFLWDVAFVKGGPGTPKLFSPEESGGLETRRTSLIRSGVPADIAVAAALFEQAPTYQTGNKNRIRHRTERIAQELATRDDLLGDMARAYQTAAATTSSKARTADDRKFEAHEAGMRAITEMLDKQQ